MTAAPTFLIIGAARSGTTYLSHQLGRHPDIGITDPKEPHFLALAGTVAEFTGPGDNDNINRMAVTDEAGWRSLFEPISGLAQRGEGSVSSLYYSEATIANIQRYCPDVQLIALLRDPVDRAFSAYQYCVSRGIETETFGRLLDLEDERRQSGYHHIWQYVGMSRYVDQLEPFLTAFSSDRLLVLGYEDFMADPETGIARCHAFLGVHAWQTPGLDDEVNVGGQPKSKAIQALMVRGRMIEPLRTAVRATIPFSVREKIRSANVRRSGMVDDDRARLEVLLGDQRAGIARLLGSDAPGWATNAVGQS